MDNGKLYGRDEAVNVSGKSLRVPRDRALKIEKYNDSVSERKS